MVVLIIALVSPIIVLLALFLLIVFDPNLK